MLSIISCVCWPSVCLIWRNVYLGLLPIFQVGCLFFVIVVELYESFIHFGDQPFVCCLICIDFLLFCGLLFHFINGFLWRAEAFGFNEVWLVYFWLYYHYSMSGGQTRCCFDMSKSVLPMFSSGFIVYRLTFRSLIHFEFIFVYGVRKCSNFILLHVIF